MRLIDADVLMRTFAEFVAPSNRSDFARIPTWNDAVSLLGSAPTVDAEPVVRCKDCIHWSYANEECIYHDFEDHPYGYCAWGERREDETD